MKGLIIFDSSHGNTRKVAEMISKALKDSEIETDVFYVKKAKKLEANDYDFLVLGSPTRFGTMSFTMKRFLCQFKGKDWRDKPFTAFDTEMAENIEKQEGSAAEKIAVKLTEHNMKQIRPVLKTEVSGMTGPLADGTLKKVTEYTTDLACACLGDRAKKH